MYTRETSSHRRHRHNRHYLEAVIGYVLFAIAFMFLLANIVTSTI